MQRVLLSWRGLLIDMAKRIGKYDRIFLSAVFLVLVTGGIWFYFFSGEEGAVAEVTVDGEFYGAYSLKKDQIVEIVVNEKVTNVLQIKNGKADMTTAECPDLLCVRQRAISNQNETIVCLPNKVVVEIVGGKKAELDSVT